MCVVFAKRVNNVICCGFLMSVLCGNADERKNFLDLENVSAAFDNDLVDSGLCLSIGTISFFYSGALLYNVFKGFFSMSEKIIKKYITHYGLLQSQGCYSLLAMSNLMYKAKTWKKGTSAVLSLCTSYCIAVWIYNVMLALMRHKKNIVLAARYIQKLRYDINRFRVLQHNIETIEGCDEHSNKYKNDWILLLQGMCVSNQAVLRLIAGKIQAFDYKKNHFFDNEKDPVRISIIQNPTKGVNVFHQIVDSIQKFKKNKKAHALFVLNQELQLMCLVRNKELKCEKKIIQLLLRQLICSFYLKKMFDVPRKITLQAKLFINFFSSASLPDRNV